MKNFIVEINNIRITSKITQKEFVRIFPKFKLKIYGDIFDYHIKGLIFNMKYLSDIFITFKNENIVEICVLPTNERLNILKNNLKESYKDYNKSLESIYGKRLSNNFVKQKTWRFKDAILEHYIFERFGIEERIEIFFKKRVKNK